MNIKISCIIPIYNAHSYIRRCLDSILKQTLKDFEVIIIDDGSTDNSVAIVKEYLDKDSRIKLISQNNQGVSIARNNGIHVAIGEYIFFLDADDDITKNAFKLSYEKAKKDMVDMLIFNYNKINKTKYSIKKKKLKDTKIYSTIKDKKAILSSGVTPWSKIYRKDFLLNNTVFFHPNIYYEDIPFFWKSVIVSQKISFLNDAIYNYYQNDNSIMNSNLSEKKIQDIVKSMLLVRNYLLDYNVYDSYKYIYETKVIKTFIAFVNDIVINKKNHFKMMGKSLNFINLKDYKKKLSLFKYLKYKCFLSGKYILYRLFFAWF
ncbi:MAG: glycosyltransferase [Alphaproteobacteria bacterium]|jgi:glycosyltransferase involved in cell wall biosynthesis|nr:glycosyltransferase [Alphaproteobacteria bacterium]